MSSTTINRLNVVLHGTMAIVVDQEKIRVLIPDLQDYDIFAGSFREEKELQKAVYALKGVKAVNGSLEISRDNNILVAKKPLKNPKVKCKLEFPKPVSFRSIRPMDINRAWFNTSDEAISIKDELALAHVLSYELDSDDEPWLEEVPSENPVFWKASPAKDLKSENSQQPEHSPSGVAPSGAVNLHVYADPKLGSFTPGVGHSKLAFEELMGFFNAKVELNGPVGNFVAPPNAYPDIRGLEDELELMDYLRSRRGYKAAASLPEMSTPVSSPGLEAAKLPQVPPPVSSPPYHCGQVIGLPGVSTTAANMSFSVTV